ncbi:MAG: leucine-rich repeat domain-containing protein [Candidatus Saccharimonadales bacterium]
MNNKLITGLLIVLLAGTIGYIASQRSGDDNKPAYTIDSKDTAAPATKDKTVDLSGQQLTAIPEDVLQQTDITSLNLSNNQLTSLPAEISQFKNLTTLNVENNRLETLPPEIGQLTKLKSADFGNNRLQSLPSELGDLVQIRQLNLSGYKGSSADVDQLKAKLTGTEVKT